MLILFIQINSALYFEAKIDNKYANMQHQKNQKNDFFKSFSLLIECCFK